MIVEFVDWKELTYKNIERKREKEAMEEAKKPKVCNFYARGREKVSKIMILTTCE